MVHEPVPLQWVMDMHKLYPGGTTVGVSQRLENFAQAGFGWCEIFNWEDPVKICFFKTECLKAEEWVLSFAGGEGVRAGEQVSNIPVPVDERLHCGNCPGGFRNRGGYFRSGYRRSYLQAAEKICPLKRDEVGGFLPEKILLFDPLRADTVEKTHENILGDLAVPAWTPAG